MALTNMTLSSSSASSSCDVTDLNTADVDLTYLEETESQHIKQENHIERVNETDGMSRGENNKAKIFTNMNGSDGDGGEEEEDDDDNDLSGFDLNGLDTVGVNNPIETNDEIILNRIVDSSNVKVENASDLEQVNDLYTKLLIHSNMNSVNGINDVDLVTNTIIEHSSPLKTTRTKESQLNVNMINVGFNPMRH